MSCKNSGQTRLFRLRTGYPVGLKKLALLQVRKRVKEGPAAKAEHDPLNFVPVSITLAAFSHIFEKISANTAQNTPISENRAVFGQLSQLHMLISG